MVLRLTKFLRCALLPAALLAVLVGPQGLHAQSYLSFMPVPHASGASAQPGEEPDGVSGTSYADLTLDELFGEVFRGNGHAVYHELNERFDSEMIRAAASPWEDPNALRKIYLINLLRAGEGLAPPTELEQTARDFTEYYPDDEQFPVAFFHLNQALFQQGKPLEESFFFDQQALEALPAWMQTRYLRMLATNEEKNGNYERAATYLLTEKESGTTLPRTTQAEVEDMLERLTSPVELLSFLERHPQIAWLYEREPYLLATVLFNSGQLDQALLRLVSIQAGGLASNAADLKFVNDMKNAIRTRVATRPRRIGVLLPLGSSSSLLRGLAVETLQGLRMAIQFPGVKGAATSPLSRLLAQDLPVGMERVKANGDGKPPAFELIIRDTANSPKAAARLTESLVRDDQVIAIIGPIARSESAAAAAKAQEMGVPLISLSLSLEIPPEANYVFRHSKSQEEEVRDLVRYAIDYLHARRFAILHPDTPYGRKMASLFWRHVERHHASIVAVAAFEPTLRVSRLSRRRVGFKKIFERFTGVDRPISEEERALLELSGDVSPDPIVDFDALFIPVGPNGTQDLQVIARYPVTVDAEHVQLLGSRFWNDAAVLVAGKGKLEGAVFVDAFDLTSANPKVAAFQTRHRTFFGHHAQYRPPTYYTGLGYDTANLLMRLLLEPAIRTRESLRRALLTTEPFFGVTGWTRFKETGEAVKESMFFRIKGNEIVRVVP